jgi:hypothetical protein
MAGVILLFSIVVLSTISLFQLIYEIIIYIISIFVNPQSTKGSSIDYLSKNIIRCTKTDLTYDTYYIISVQKQNLLLFNFGGYIIYLLLIYVVLYFLLVLYAKFMKQQFAGKLTDIDSSGAFLPIIGIIVAYSFAHFFIYKFIFKKFVFVPYLELNNKEKNTDELVTKSILIYNSDKDILVDNNFFDIIYDLTRIDELNTIFSNGIESKNSDNCLEQKLIIYDIYMYLREYVVFDNTMKDKFREYCTSAYDKKPYYLNTNNKITFLSLLNNKEVKMIKKYHEELAFFNTVSDNNLEFYNNLNKSVSNKIKEINTQIITHNKTMIPFFTTVFYILLILIFNLIIFYIILNLILKDTTKFSYYFVQAAIKINRNFYDRIINYLTKS